MKKLLLTGIAALALMTSIAHAGDFPVIAEERAIRAKLDPEALALRVQYQQALEDRNISNFDAYILPDLKKAFDLMAYDKQCAPIGENRMHRAQVFLRAFPEYYDDAKRRADWGLQLFGNDLCRSMNPTPKPML